MTNLKQNIFNLFDNLSDNLCEEIVMKEDHFDKRNMRKLTPEEIKDYLLKLPCSICNKVEPCECTYNTTIKKKTKKSQKEKAGRGLI